jgi:hypothetical protein
MDVTAWGWTTLIWGGLLIVAGLGLLGGADWARWLAIIGVGINAIGQIAFTGEGAERSPLGSDSSVQMPPQPRAATSLRPRRRPRSLPASTLPCVCLQDRLASPVGR